VPLRLPRLPHQHPQGEVAQTLPLVVLGLGVMLLMASFVLETGEIYLTRQRLEAAGDASAVSSIDCPSAEDYLTNNGSPEVVGCQNEGAEDTGYLLLVLRGTTPGVMVLPGERQCVMSASARVEGEIRLIDPVDTPFDLSAYQGC
jgi:hypothetical protein